MGLTEDERNEIEDALASLYDVLAVLYDDPDYDQIDQIEAAVAELEEILSSDLVGEVDDDPEDYPYDLKPMTDNDLSSMRGVIFLSPDEAAEYLDDIPTGGRVVYWNVDGVFYYGIVVYNSEGLPE